MILWTFITVDAVIAKFITTFLKVTIYLFKKKYKPFLHVIYLNILDAPTFLIYPFDKLSFHETRITFYQITQPRE